jgi:predicted dehydrogenase
MAEEVLNSKKHLLLEKPTTTNALEARKLLALARLNSCIGMMSHEFRYMPERNYSKDLISEGKIGKIREFHFHFYGSFAVGEDSHRFGWLWDAVYDGGMLGAAGSHIIDWIRYAINDEVKSVQGRLLTLQKTRKGPGDKIHEVTADDGFYSLVETKGGIKGIISLTTTLTSPPTTRFVIGGTEGTIMIEGADVYVGKKGEKLEKNKIPESYNLNLELEEKDNRIAPYLKLLDRFSLALDKRETVSPSLYDGWKNQQFIDALKLSHTTGSNISIVDSLT